MTVQILANSFQNSKLTSDQTYNYHPVRYRKIFGINTDHYFLYRDDRFLMAQGIHKSQSH